MKIGYVDVDTFNNDNDAIILSLTCQSQRTLQEERFITLFDTILLSAYKHNFPQTAGELLSLEILVNKDQFVDCTFIEDAIELVSNELNDTIEIDAYIPVRIHAGRNELRLLACANEDNNVAYAVPFLGIRSFIHSPVGAAMEVMNHIIQTDPLATREMLVPSSVRKYLHELYVKQCLAKEEIEYYDPIILSIRKGSPEDSMMLNNTVSQMYREFRKKHFLDEQDLIQDDREKPISVMNYLLKHKVAIFGDFTKYKLK